MTKKKGFLGGLFGGLGGKKSKNTKNKPPQGGRMQPNNAPQGRPMPPQGRPMPSQGRPMPPQGRPMPPQGGSGANSGGPGPKQGRPMPPQGRPPQGRPPQGRPIPPQGGPAPSRPPQGGPAPSRPPQGRPPQGIRPMHEPQPKEFDVERKYFGKVESQQMFGQRQMKQEVFMYAPPLKYVTIKNYVEDTFTGISVVGTSNINGVYEEYKKKLNVRHLVLIVQHETEIEELQHVINSGVQTMSTNPEILQVYIVVMGQGFNINALHIIPNNHLLTVMAVDEEYEHITSSTINEVFTGIINQQPSYIEDKPLEAPAMAERTETLENIMFSIKNMEELKRDVEIAKNTVNRKELMETLDEKITFSTKSEDVLTIDELIPETAVLNEYKRQLDEYLEDVGDDADPAVINEIIVSNLEISKVKQDALNEIFSKFIDIGETKNMDAETREVNESLMFEYEDIRNSSGSDIELTELLEKRAEMKDRVTAKFADYKKVVQRTSNAIELRRYFLQQNQLELNNVLELTEGKVHGQIAETSLAMIKDWNDQNNKLKKYNADIEERLVNTVNFANSLLADYQVVVDFDTIVIDRMQDEIERLRAGNIVKVYQVETQLKATAKSFIIVNNEMLMKLTKALFARDMLIVTDLSFQVSETMVDQTVPQFIDDYSDKRCNVVRISGNETEEQFKAMLSKMNFLSNNPFRRIYFVFSEETPDNILDLGLGNSMEVVTYCNAEKSSLMEINTILSKTAEKEIYSHKAIIDTTVNGEPTHLGLSDMRTLGGFGDITKEHFLEGSKLRTSADYGNYISTIRSLLK